jgi:hypothetical protein
MLMARRSRIISYAVMVGIGIAVVSTAISEIMTPCAALTRILRRIATVLTVRTAHCSLIMALSEESACFDPLNENRLVSSVSHTAILFLAGLFFYSKYSWKKQYRHRSLKICVS